MTRRYTFLSLSLMVCLGPFSSRAVPGDEHWDPQFGVPGVTNAIYAMALDNGLLYAGGGAPSGIPTNAPLYLWDGKQWSVVATFSGPAFMQVDDMAFVGNTLYVAGSFTGVNGVAASGVARWDGSSWTGIGFSGTAYALAVDGNDLYVGGSYTNVGGVTTTNIGYWDGSAWHALGNGLTSSGGSPSVRSVAVQNGSVYAGGIFTNSGPALVTNLAVWDGSSWTQVGGGVSGGVLALGFKGSDLYVGGSFSQVGNVAAADVAEWDGTNWSNLGGGVTGGGAVSSLAFLNGTVCVAGSFTGAGGTTSSNFVIWNGSSWSGAGSGLTSAGLRAVSTGTNVFVGGNFGAAGGVLVNFVGSWDGTQWTGLGTPGRLNGVQGFVFNINSDSQSIYAGGTFAYAGPNQAGSIARFDGTNWYAVGGKGVNFGVNTMAFFDNQLIVGSLLSPYIFAWNGVSWTVPTNDSISGPVSAMAVGSNGLYLAGSFWYSDVSNEPAFYCGHWDGTNWWRANPAGDFTINLPPPPNGVGMNAVAVQGSNVFFGGNFVAQDLVTFPGGISATNILRWDGSHWQLMGTGVNSNVEAMAVSGTNLYVGGLFTNASGIAASKIAVWNGHSWSALGTGVVGSGTVFALATIGNDLFAGGSFTNMGGVPASHIAKWDGTNWYALGSGVGGRSSGVQALFVSGSDLYVGGNFQGAGDKRASSFARWNEQINFDTPQLIHPARLMNGQFQVRLVGISGVASVIQASTNFMSWTPILTNSTGLYDFVDSNSGVYPYRFYRAEMGQ